MRDVRLASLTLLVTVRLICEIKSLLELRVIPLDIFVIEICGARILIVKLNDLIEPVLKVLGDLGLNTVVVKIGTLGFSLNDLFSIYGIKCSVILALSHR